MGVRLKNGLLFIAWLVCRNGGWFRLLLPRLLVLVAVHNGACLDRIHSGWFYSEISFFTSFLAKWILHLIVPTGTCNKSEISR